MDLYPTSDSALDAYERSQLSRVRTARLVLWGMAALNTVLAVSIPVGYAALPSLSGGDVLPSSLIGASCVGLFVAAVGVAPMALAAVGLGRGARWGWGVTVAIGGLYTPGLCLPVGALLLYTMLNDEVRRAFLR